MLREIVAFEWRYHARQPAFLAASLIFLLFGFAVGRSFGPSNIAVNTPYVVMESTGFISLLSVFAVAIFAANAVLRDVEHRMDGIVFTTAVSKFDYLFGRFAGALLATLSVVAFSMIGMIAVRFGPWLDPERIAPFDVRPYLASFAVMTVPNVAFAAALLFALAVLTRNALATYAGAVVLYVLYLMSAALTNSPLMAASSPGAGGGTGAALLDPFGLSAFFEVTRFWTASSKSTTFVGTQPLLLANRAIWLAATAAIWVFVNRTFSFRTRGSRVAPGPRGLSERRLSADRAAGILPASFPPGTMPATSRRPGRLQAGAPKSALLESFLSATNLQLRVLVSKPFLALLVLWLGLAASEVVSNILDAEYGAALYPATGLILDALRTPLGIIGTILLIFYGSELLWREQRDRFASILDATPVSGAVLVGAKVIAMAAMIASLIGVGLIPGIVLQLARGPEHLSVAAYLSFFASAGLPLLVFGVAVLLINSLSPGKYAGMVLSMLFAIVAGRPSIVGLEHPLWAYGSAPPVRFSEVNGFGYDALPFAAFMLHWSAMAVLFFLAAAALWRGLAFPVRERVRFLRRAPKVGLAMALIASAMTGTWLFAHIDAEDVPGWKAEYETRYKGLAALPQPRIAAIDTSVDLFDQRVQRRVQVSGRYELLNATRAPISRVLVAVRRDAMNVTLSLPGATMRRDDRFGVYDLALARPLLPGARTELRFASTFVRDRFASDADDAIAANGSFLLSFRILPTLGYRQSYEIVDPRERRKRGLGELVETIEGDVPANAEDVRFAATISTPLDQTPVAPGRIERTWTRGGRRFTRFADAGMRNYFAIASARYEVARRTHNGTALELYYHRAHATNANRMLDVAAKTLDYCQSNFGPYRPAQLRMAEVPSYWNFGALAMPNSIFLTEHRTFLIDGRDPNRPDLLGRRIAHEVAHQWWGYEVAPAGTPGSTFIVESLAKYTELMVLERMHGRESIRRLLEIERDRYLAGRASDENPEPPLLRVANQAHIYYGKGALVLYAMRDLLGERTLNAALRAFVAEQSRAHGRTRGTDLLPHLRRVANDEQFALIEQWLKEIVLYDLSLASTHVTKRGDGRYDVIVRVKAAKTRADGEGNETPLPFHESIDLRITDADGAPLYERKHILDGDDTLTITVGREPASVEVDPWMLRIDTNVKDNEG